jgi:hypothetical protein
MTQVAKRLPPPFASKLLALLAVFLLPLSSFGRPNSQTSSQDKSPRKVPTRPDRYPPPVAQELDGAFWRTDGGFRATIRITNILQPVPIKVTPVLFMADGTEYILPEVKLLPAGVATVSVNDALSNAPPEIAVHISNFGSAALRFQWAWATAVSGAICNLDVQKSMNYNNAFRFSMITDLAARAHRLATGPKKRDGTQEKPVEIFSKAVSLEGPWWLRTPDDGGFVMLTNRSSEPLVATVKVFAPGVKSEYNTSLSLLPHRTQQVDLKRAFGNLPSGTRSGGIRIQYQGVQSTIAVTGGMENAAAGYAAKIPFGSVPAPDAKLGSWPMASVGIMHGPPDPTMQFPADLRFISYVVLRNTSAQPAQVTATLYVTPGRTPDVQTQTILLPVLTVNPGETSSLDLEGPLNSKGLTGISAGLTLSLKVYGVPGGLLAAIGSIDHRGDYVFAVDPRLVTTTLSQSLGFFEAGKGTDTVFSLWNQSNQAEDLLVTLFFEGGLYKLPVHLAARQSVMLNVMEIIKAQRPDAEGNVIPSSITRGSAVVTGPHNETDKIDVTVNAATLSVQGQL